MSNFTNNDIKKLLQYFHSDFKQANLTSMLSSCVFEIASVKIILWKHWRIEDFQLSRITFFHRASWLSKVIFSCRLLIFLIDLTIVSENSQKESSQSMKLWANSESILHTSCSHIICLSYSLLLRYNVSLYQTYGYYPIC